MTHSALTKLYNEPHYYYKVISDDKEIFGSVDKKKAIEVYNKTDGDYVELVQLNHGNYHKTLKEKEKE